MAERGAPWVLVTGAGSGIGRACAEALYRRGYAVAAGARDARARLGRPGGDERWLPVELDVCCAESVRAAGATLERHVGAGALRALVNSAGVATFGPLEFTPPAAVREQLEVNVLGALRVTQALLPMLRRARGRVVNVGSISGRVAPPFLGAYAASKFALEALSDALRRELAGAGVRVVLVEAGRVATPIWERSVAAADALRAEMPCRAEAEYGAVMGALRARATRGGGLPAERVAEQVVRCIEVSRPRARYVVGGDARRRALMRWLPDSVVDRLLTRRIPRAGG